MSVCSIAWTRRLDSTPSIVLRRSIEELLNLRRRGIAMRDPSRLSRSVRVESRQTHGVVGQELWWGHDTLRRTALARLETEQLGSIGRSTRRRWSRGLL